MILTEEEAKTKTCPLIRYWAGSDNSNPIYAHAVCLGSACMAWRTPDTGYEFAKTDNVAAANGWAIQSVPPPGDGWKRVERSAFDMAHTEWMRPKPDATPRGFCGLAGDPNKRTLHVGR